MRCQLEAGLGDDLSYLQPVVEVLSGGFLLQLDDVIADFICKVDGHLFQCIQLVLVHAANDVVHITLQLCIVHGVQLLLAAQGGVDDVAAQFQPVLTRHQGELLPDKLLILGFHFRRTGRTIAIQIDLCQIVVQMVEVDVAGLTLQSEVAQQILLGQLLRITGH